MLLVGLLSVPCVNEIDVSSGPMIATFSYQVGSYDRPKSSPVAREIATGIIVVSADINYSAVGSYDHCAVLGFCYATAVRGLDGMLYSFPYVGHCPIRDFELLFRGLGGLCNDKKKFSKIPHPFPDLLSHAGVRAARH